MFIHGLGKSLRGNQTKVNHYPLILLIVLSLILFLAGCHLPASPTPGVALIHPADGYFLPFAPYTLDAEAIGGQFAALNFTVNDLTVASVPVDPASPGVMAHYVWTPPATGEYYLEVDGIGGPGGANRYLSHRAHVCVTRTVTTAMRGYTGTGCDPMPPTPAFTTVHGWPDPVYYDAPAGSLDCPGDITISAELNDIAHIDHVMVHFDFFTGSDTAPFGSWQDEIGWKADNIYANDYILSSLTDVDFSALHGGDGSVSFYVYAFDIGSVRVARSDPITLQLRHCIAATATPAPTLLPTMASTISPTSTPVPTPTRTLPPLKCEQFNNIPNQCKLLICFYWPNGICSSSPPPCSLYTDSKSCKAASCEWDDKLNSCN